MNTEAEDQRDLPSPPRFPAKIYGGSRPFRGIKDASREVKDVDKALDDQISTGKYICHEHRNPYALKSRKEFSAENAALSRFLCCQAGKLKMTGSQPMMTHEEMRQSKFSVAESKCADHAKA